MFHACEMATHVKCYSTCVTWNFTREVHIYMLQETWSTQPLDMNSISLCCVSLLVVLKLHLSSTVNLPLRLLTITNH